MNSKAARNSLLSGAAALGTGSLTAVASGQPLLAAAAAAACASLLGFLLARRAETETAPATEPSAQGEGTELALVIADSNPDALLFFSDSGEIRYANQAARELFFEGRDPTHDNFLRLLAAAPAPLREALLGEQTRLVAIELDGQRETYHVTRRTLESSGELHTLLAVKHVTREIARQEVDVLKRVVRVISHEVNNSLAPISSLVHSARILAKSPEGAGKLDRIFGTIEERAEHLGSFLKGYATMARLPAPRARAVDWKTFLEPIAVLYPDVRFPAPPAEKGYFDPVQLEQVVINLIKNAIEAGCVPADVELELATAQGGACELRIHDRGHGFSDEALQNALLPLYSTKEQGSGMGLALAHEIVEAHGGSLSIANRLGGGATVALRLPGREPLASPLTRSRLTLTRG